MAIGTESWTDDPARPGVELGHPEVAGSLAPSAIEKVVRARRSSLRRCREEAGGPAITLTIRFVIGRDGAVSQVNSSPPSSKLAACAVRTFYGLAFQQPNGGIVRVAYPVTLTPPRRSRGSRR